MHQVVDHTRERCLRSEAATLSRLIELANEGVDAVNEVNRDELSQRTAP